MKEFLVYKFYMTLLDILRVVIILVLITLAVVFSATILSNMVLLVSTIILVIAIYIFISIKMSSIKGKVGEFITQKVIESYCNKRGYAYLYDVMIKNEVTETSQIDHLIITRKGLAVIETKFHTGTIYGTEFADDWTYKVKTDEGKSYKHQYHNPLKQNYGHIEALKKIIDKDIEYYNIVLYIDTVDLKKCEVKNKFSKVGYTYDLDKTLEEFDSLSEKKIYSEDSYEIYNKIKSLNISDKDSRKEHIERIRQKVS